MSALFRERLFVIYLRTKKLCHSHSLDATSTSEWPLQIVMCDDVDVEPKTVMHVCFISDNNIIIFFRRVHIHQMAHAKANEAIATNETKKIIEKITLILSVWKIGYMFYDSRRRRFEISHL